MLKVIVYESFEEKKLLEREVLSEEQALIQTLNVMDLNAAISCQNPALKVKSNHEWIELNYYGSD